MCRSCPEVISRLLKSDKSVLLAAKVLVISRLLHKKLSQHPESPPYLENLRNRLTTLRRKVLTKIDNRFKSLNFSSDGLVEAMCAFSLATSSSPTDVLRHFHRVRQEAISDQIHNSRGDHENSLQALRIYIKTLKDTKTLVPGQLARALERLKSVPLFKSSDLYSLIELNLDLHERWIGDDIKIFKPYIRQDDLQRSEAERLLSLWAKQAFSSFLNDINDIIQGIDEPMKITQLRRQILELWFSNSRLSVGLDAKKALDGLRNSFNSQLTRLVHDRVASLSVVTSTIQLTLNKWQVDTFAPNLPLWAPSITSMDISSGAKTFRETLLTTINGRTSSLQSIRTKYATWLTRISAIEATIETLRSETWDDDDLDDMDEMDIPLTNKQTLLSSEDPLALRHELSTSLTTAFNSLESSLKVPPPSSINEHSGRMSVYLLRILRELRQQLPFAYQDPNLGLGSIPLLHNILARAALADPWEECRRRRRRSSNKVAGRKLWEGDPELPVLPSPWAFRFLKDLTESMAEFGVDVWSSAATDVLKETLRLMIASEFKESPPDFTSKTNGHPTVKTNGETEQETNAVNGTSRPPSPPTTSPDKNDGDIRIQRLFDSLYLSHATALKTKETDKDAMEILTGQLRDRAHLENEGPERMEKSAEEYWKRTGMLFGLLN